LIDGKPTKEALLYYCKAACEPPSMSRAHVEIIAFSRLVEWQLARGI